MISILNNKGTTLVETLLAFSIFISIIVVFVTLYNGAATKGTSMIKEYHEYQEQYQIKEQEICLENQLVEIIQQALP